MVISKWYLLSISNFETLTTKLCCRYWKLELSVNIGGEFLQYLLLPSYQLLYVLCISPYCNSVHRKFNNLIMCLNVVCIFMYGGNAYSSS